MDALHGDDLLLQARTRRAIAVALMRPAGLEIVDVGLAIAVAGQGGKGGGDEGAGSGSGGLRVEEWVDVAADDVDDGAEGGEVVVEDVHGLGGGDGACVAGAAERGFDLRDEGGERGPAAEVVEDGLVADDDHLDLRVVAREVGRDVGDLAFGGADAGAGDVDAQHEFEAVGGGGGADVGQAVAVGGVDADGGEAFGRDGGHVGGDVGLRFAGAGRGVGAVGHAPLGAALDGSRGAGGAGGLGAGGAGRGRGASGRSGGSAGRWRGSGCWSGG